MAVATSVRVRFGFVVMEQCSEETKNEDCNKDKRNRRAPQRALPFPGCPLTIQSASLIEVGCHVDKNLMNGLKRQRPGDPFHQAAERPASAFATAIPDQTWLICWLMRCPPIHASSGRRDEREAMIGKSGRRAS